MPRLRGMIAGSLPGGPTFSELMILPDKVSQQGAGRLIRRGSLVRVMPAWRAVSITLASGAESLPPSRAS